MADDEIIDAKQSDCPHCQDRNALIIPTWAHEKAYPGFVVGSTGCVTCGREYKILVEETEEEHGN